MLPSNVTVVHFEMRVLVRRGSMSVDALVRNIEDNI